MARIVINTCFGGFGLSHAAMVRYAELKGFPLTWRFDDIDRKVRAQLHNEEPLTPDNACIVHYYKSDSREEKLPDNLYFSERGIPRDDPTLLIVVQELAERAAGKHAELTIVEIPDDVEWEIENYDGAEHIAEKHRVWGGE